MSIRSDIRRDEENARDLRSQTFLRAIRKRDQGGPLRTIESMEFNYWVDHDRATLTCGHRYIFPHRGKRKEVGMKVCCEVCKGEQK